MKHETTVDGLRSWVASDNLASQYPQLLEVPELLELIEAALRVCRERRNRSREPASGFMLSRGATLRRSADEADALDAADRGLEKALRALEFTVPWLPGEMRK